MMIRRTGSRWILNSVLLALAGCAMIGSAQAADVEAELGVYSAYVWRGLIVNDEAVLQPSLTVGAGNFSINVWGNFDLTDSLGDSAQFSEIELTISYAHKVGSALFEAGVVNYMFPNLATEVPDTDTTEVYFSAAFDVILEPSVTFYYDVDVIEGHYLIFGIGHTFKINEKTNLGMEATYGFGGSSYVDGYFGVDDSGPIDLGLGVFLRYSINDAVGFSAGVHYMSLMGSALKESVGDEYGTKTTFSTVFTFMW